MSSLSKAQQDLILDFYFRCGDDESIAAGRDLIASNPEAARLYADLEQTLTDLDELKYEPCPDNLVELTVARLKAAAAGQTRLAGLLADQERQPVAAPAAQRRWWAPLRVAAMAALFLLITGIGVPVLRNLRYSAWQTVCRQHLSRLGVAMAQYAGDYEGFVPHEPLAAGSPWWKVGYQGPENQSVTRSYYKLIRLGYVQGEDFTCPGQVDVLVVSGPSGGAIHDFPSRRYVSYSFPLYCGQKPQVRISDKTIAAADRNPVFTGLPSDGMAFERDEFGQIVLTEQLQRMLSPNHRGQGQNVLWTDGSVQFLKDRTIGGDDLFTVIGRTSYVGTEAPCSRDDRFLVP